MAMFSIRGCLTPSLRTTPWRMLIAALSTTVLAWVAPAHAVFPDRPIRLIVPFPAGSANDLVARSVNERLSKRIGKPVIIENRPGAAGATATQSFVDSAPPDGYQLLLGSVSLGTHFAIRRGAPLHAALHESHWYANHTCSVPRESAGRARAHG